MNKGLEVVVLEDFRVILTPRDKKRHHSAQLMVDVAIGNQRQSLIASANNAHLQMAIADMIHCDGLRFAHVGSTRFRKVLKLAKTASAASNARVATRFLASFSTRTLSLVGMGTGIFLLPKLTFSAFTGWVMEPLLDACP